MATRFKNQRSWRDHDGAAGKHVQPVFQRAQGVDVQVVGRLVQEQQIGVAGEDLRQVDAVALAAGEVLHQLLLVGAVKIEAGDEGA